MTTIDFKKATRLDLEIWDTQNKIKYIKLPTSNKGVKKRLWNNYQKLKESELIQIEVILRQNN